MTPEQQSPVAERPAALRRYRWAVLLGLLAGTAVEELRLRPYLFRHHITRWGLADSLPNFLAPLLFVGLYVTVWQKHTRPEVARACASAAAGLVLYECAQYFMPDRVFDLKDLVATLLGTLVAWGLFQVGCSTPGRPR